MKSQGFLYVDINSVVNSEKQQTIKCLPEYLIKTNIKECFNNEKNVLLSLIHNVFEFVCLQFPQLKHFLLTKLFPYYAAYLFI